MAGWIGSSTGRSMNFLKANFREEGWKTEGWKTI